MPPPKDHHANALALHQYIMTKDQTKLKDNPQAVLDAINDYTDNVQRLMTYSNKKLEVTEKQLAKLDPKPKVLVELGGYVGKSAIAWGPLLERIASTSENTTTSPGTIKVYSLELESDFCKVIQEFVDLAGLSKTVTVMQGDSATSLRRLKESGLDHIDVLFLDHWEQCYVPDLRLCEELGLLREGSVIVADNTDMPGAPGYLKYVEAGGEGGWKYRCESISVNEGKGKPSIVHFAYVEATP